jgi:hypothetical protein
MKPTMTPTMTEYRIVELNRMFSIEVNHGKEWGDLNLYGVPRFFDSLADARSWVATIKRGVVYHDAEDAPNLAQDERKAEGDTSDDIKPIGWFLERVGKSVLNLRTGLGFAIMDEWHARASFHGQDAFGNRYTEIG